MNNKTKRIILISALVIALALMLCYIFIINSNSPIEFTPEKWNKHIWQRERMLDSLNSKYDFSIMNYDQIIELLGMNGVAENSGKDNIKYYIGIQKVSILQLIFAEDTIIKPFFLIKFDENGNISETCVCQ